MNILLNNNSTINNLKSSNSDMINSAVIKPQFNNSNNNSKVYINNDSNTHLNLNIYSSRSLNNNKNFMKDNINANTNETFNINKITSNGNISSEFKGKKIKCIHDISKTGLSGDEKKVNQDRDFIFHNFVSGFDNIFMGVCDGHGFFGHEISEFIKEMNL